MAINAPVEFVVPDTTLAVSGYASPGAFVSIYDNNTLIGTTLASSNARFSKNFVALESGLHNLKLDYMDKSGRKSNSITDTVSVAFHKETAVEYFLPPTFEVSPSKVAESDMVTFSGSSVPGAQLQISIDGGNTVLRPQVDASGNYSISMATDGYFFGQHPSSVTAKFAGNTSYESDKKSFEVIVGDSEALTKEQESNLQPPVIVSPESPYSTDDVDQIIRGTAAPNQQIILFVDGEPVGSTFSNADGQWFFNIKLYSDKHEIKAITCIDSECSDFSNVLEVKFTGDFGKCKDVKFILDDYRYWGINPGNGINLNLSQLTGVPAFQMSVDWGDGVVERFDHSDQDGFEIHHVFRNAGQFNGNVTIQDNQDCSFTRNFTTDVQPKELRAVDMWWLMPAGLTIGFAMLLRYKNKD